MTIAIAKEPFNAKLATEILPLAQKSWDASTEAKNTTCAYHGDRAFAIEPDIEIYQRLADSGALVVVALREAGELKGYVLGFRYNSMHHKRVPCGMGDSIYVEPSHRSYTWALVKRFEKELAALGVEIIGWPATIDSPIHKLLKATGYVADDVVMEKRIICVSH